MLLAVSTNERASDDNADPTIFEFTIPKDDYERSCLKMSATYVFGATYEALNDKVKL